MEIGGNTRAQLIGVVERLERVTEEIDGLKDDLKEVLGEAKSAGFDVPTLRRVIRLRAMDPAQRAALTEREAIVDLYMSALDE